VQRTADGMGAARPVAVQLGYGVRSSRRSLIPVVLTCLAFLGVVLYQLTVDPLLARADSTSPYPQEAELTASDGAAADALGTSVAVSGSTMVVGATGGTGVTSDEGAVYVFSDSSGVWKQTAELTASDGAAGDQFGSSVAVSGTTIAVGAPDHRVGSNPQQGAAYVFSNSSGVWTQTAELTASDGAAYDMFGSSVAVSGTTIVAGAPAHQVGSNVAEGVAYVFSSSAGAWTQTAELTGSGPMLGGDPTPFGFGAVVAISGTTIAVGAHGGAEALYVGAVYVFSDGAGAWTQTAELTEYSGGQSELSGGVAISGSTIAAGSLAYGGPPLTQQGEVFVFSDASGSWLQTGAVTSTDGAPTDWLGKWVGISGSTIVAGAPYHQVGSNPRQGAVYVFSDAAGGWTQTAELTASDGAAYDQLGAVAISGSTIVSGAPFHEVGSSAAQGAAYVFGGPTDYTVSGTVSDKQCGEDGCEETGAGGVKVLVTGTAADGSAVSITGISAAGSGAWSVTVPAGAYSAGPTQDGSSFGPAGVTPVSQAVSVTDEDVGAVDFVMPVFTVSGTVSADSCDPDEGSCSSVGLGGVTVLLKGDAADATPVSVSDTSDDGDGSWSVQVPAGASYTAGPTDDGESFGGLGFDPSDQPVAVSASDVGGVDFSTCAAAADSDSDSDMASFREAGYGVLARPARAAYTLPNQCTSVYTVTVGGEIPQDKIVDPGPGARFDENDDGKPDYRGPTAKFNKLFQDFPGEIALKSRQLPGCFSDKQVEFYAHERDRGIDVRWDSYIQGPVTLPAVTVKFAVNQDKPAVSVLGVPSARVERMTKVWEWKEFILGVEPIGGGRCYSPEPEEIPVLYYARPDTTAQGGRGFTIIVAWGFPFNPEGVKSIGAGLGDEAQFEKVMGDLGPEGAKLATRFRSASDSTRFFAKLAAETGAVSLGAHKVHLIPYVGPAAAETAEMLHAIKDASELVEFFDGFLTGQPIMSAVIRGKFAKLGEPGDPRATTLGISVASTKFPTITLKVQRTAFDYRDITYPVFSGSLAWAQAPIASPATDNPFSRNPPGVVNDSTHNHTTYASGQTDLDALQHDTSQLPAVDSSLHQGNLEAGFDEERDLAPAPVCNRALLPDPVKASSANTICWRFNDGDA